MLDSDFWVDYICDIFLQYLSRYQFAWLCLQAVSDYASGERTGVFDRLSLTGDSGPPERKALDSSTIEILRKVQKGICAKKLDLLDQRLKALDPRKTGSACTYAPILEREDKDE